MNAAHLHRNRYVLYLIAGWVLVAWTASARITKSRPSAAGNTATYEGISSLWTPLYSLVIGSGLEYQSDSEQTEYGFPILIEYSFTEQFKLILEPTFAKIAGKTSDVRSVSGFGDLETTLDYEFLRERRYRPALSVEGAIRWPTAEDPDLGNPGRDYSLGILASKDLIFMNIDFNLLYTFIDDHHAGDTVEAALATGWPLNHYVELIAEVSYVSTVNSLRNSGLKGSSEVEALVGLAWQVTKRLKFEQGIVFKEQGILEAVFAWEWSFGGD